MKDDLKKNQNGRRAPKIMENNLNKNNLNGRRPKTNKQNFSQFLLNLGAKLSWGWLSSLRFFYLFLF
jgi:hypothetical protein